MFVELRKLPFADIGTPETVDPWRTKSSCRFNFNRSLQNRTRNIISLVWHVLRTLQLWNNKRSLTEACEKQCQLTWDTTFSQIVLLTFGIVLTIERWHLDQSASSKEI